MAGPGCARPAGLHRCRESLHPQRDGPVFPVGGVSGFGGVSAVSGGSAPRRHHPALWFPSPHPIKAASGRCGSGGGGGGGLGRGHCSEQESNLLLMLLQINSRLKQQLNIPDDLVVHHWQTDAAEASTQQLINRCVFIFFFYTYIHTLHIHKKQN